MGPLVLNLTLALTLALIPSLPSPNPSPNPSPSPDQVPYVLASAEEAEALHAVKADLYIGAIPGKG